MSLKPNPIGRDEKGRVKPRSGLIDLTGMKFNRLPQYRILGKEVVGQDGFLNVIAEKKS